MPLFKCIFLAAFCSFFPLGRSSSKRELSLSVLIFMPSLHIHSLGSIQCLHRAPNVYSGEAPLQKSRTVFVGSTDIPEPLGPVVIALNGILGRPHIYIYYIFDSVPLRKLCMSEIALSWARNWVWGAQWAAAP